MYLSYFFVSILLLQFTHIQSTPVLNETPNNFIDENNFDDTHHTFVTYLKNLLEEINPTERSILLNQLREQLNRMCIMGYFGPAHADACQYVVDLIHQNYLAKHFHVEDNNTETSTEAHGIQKRFFCNGFIGCKSVSG